MASMRSIPRPAERQPSGPRAILPANPISAGLAGVFYPNQNAIAPTGAATKLGTIEGPGFSSSSSADMWIASRTAIASRFATWTILVVFCGTTTNNPQGGVAFYSERPDDTQIVKLGMGDGQNNTAVLVVRDQQGNLAKHSGVTDIRTDSGKPRVVVGVRRSASNHALYVNGKLDAVNTSSSAGGTFGPTNAVIGNDPNDTRSYLAGASVPLVLVWSRALSDTEIASVSAKPWQVLEGRRLPVFAATAGVAPIALSGSATTIASAYGTLQSAILIAGAVEVAATSTGALSTSIRLTAEGRAAASAAGVLSTAVRLAGTAAAPSMANGALSTAITLGAVASSRPDASGALATAIPLSASVSSPSTSSATLSSISSSLLVISVSPSRATATVATAISLGASSVTPTGASAALDSGSSISAVATSQVLARAELTTVIDLVAISRTSGSAHAALAVASGAFSATAGSACTARATLATSIAVAAAALSASSATADLMSTSPVLPNDSRTYLGMARTREYVAQERVRKL